MESTQSGIVAKRSKIQTQPDTQSSFFQDPHMKGNENLLRIPWNVGCLQLSTFAYLEHRSYARSADYTRTHTCDDKARKRDKGCESHGERRSRLLLCAMRIFRNILLGGGGSHDGYSELRYYHDTGGGGWRGRILSNDTGTMTQSYMFIGMKVS